LPGGGEISTLREAGDYIIALPEREHSQTHWQTAMRCLIEAAGAIPWGSAQAHTEAAPQARKGAQDHPMTSVLIYLDIIGMSRGLETPAAPPGRLPLAQSCRGRALWQCNPT
jgi:hypothetical protein